MVDLKAISNNVAAIRQRVGSRTGIIAVVKADGYGHGAAQVARAALTAGADSLAVAIPEEGRVLREAGIGAPILVMGLVQPEEASKVIESRLEQTVASLELLRALELEARRASVEARIHVKVDTGMGRIGLQPEDVVSFVRQARELRNISVYGLYSHFATADERDGGFALRQLGCFNSVVEQLRDAGVSIPVKHIANSGAVLGMPDSFLDAVRPGIIIYGLYPSSDVERSIKLKPAMSLRTRIAQLKVVGPGTPISYGRTHITRRQTLVGTLPVGYADGYNRQLSNRVEVYLNGSRAPVIGRICMDMCMVDLTDVPTARVGDVVELFGEHIPVEELADIIGTINYEVVTGIGKRVPRVYV